MVHVTWQRHGGRAEEIAHALGGRPVHVHPTGISRRALVPVRYALSVAQTVGALVVLRPRAVVVTNPPVFPGLTVAAYAAVTRRPFVLDSHPGSFGVKGYAAGRRLLPVTRWLARRSAAVMVTVPHYARLVESWGARGIVVHEAPPLWTVAPRGERSERPRVLVVNVFAGDEPVEAVVAAAALLPEVDVVVTGDLARAPAGLVDGAAGNVEFLGFLGAEAYAAELGRADVVVTVTTEPTSIMRSAYEAVYARRPLVTSDWPSLLEVFPHAHHSANEPEGLARAVRGALADGPDTVEAALREQQERWADQLRALRTALRLA